MSTPTEADRERARKALVASSWSADVESVAQALADEREKARAPFLSVIAFVDEVAASISPARAGIPRDIARRLRHAAEETP